MSTPVAPHQPWLDLYDQVHGWTPAQGVAAAVSLLRALGDMPEPGKVSALDASASWKVFGLKKVQPLLQRGGSVRLDPKYVDHPVYALLAVRDDIVWPWSDLDAEIRALDSLDEAMALDAAWARARLARVVACGAWTEDHPDPRGALTWLQQTFLLRPRQQWLPSAVMLADLATGALADTPWARDFEAACHAHAQRRPKGTEGEKGHRARHFHVAATLAAAQQRGAFAGKSEVEWKALASDYEAMTALAGAYRLADRHAEAVDSLDAALSRFAKGFTYQIWDEARALLHDTQLPADLAERVRRVLLDLHGPETGRDLPLWTGDLYDAGRTLRDLRAQGADRAADIERLLAGRLRDAPQVVHAVEVDAQGWLDLTRSLLARVAPEVWKASPPLVRAATLAACLHLVESEHGASADWPSLAHGYPWLQAREGKVQDVARLDLFILAAGRGAAFTALLHTRLDSSAQRGTGTPIGGLATLLRGRWRRADAAEAEASWKVLPHLTQAAGTQIVRRLLAVGNDADAVGRLFLAVLSEDAPAWNHREIVSNGYADMLWSFVDDWLPELASTAALRPVLAELAAMEKHRTTADIAAHAATFATVLAAFPGLVAVAEPTGRSADCARTTLAHAPYSIVVDATDGSHATSAWVMGKTTPPAPATPSAMRAWWSKHIRDLAEALAAAGEATTAVTSPDSAAAADAQRKILLETIYKVERTDIPDVEAPLLDEHAVTTWRAGLKALRALAEPLPWHVEAELDASIRACEAWLDAAFLGAVERGQLVDQLRQAMQAGNEDEVYKQQCKSPWLLDSAFLRKIGHFYLRRLRFDRARELPARAEVPSPTSYFSPLLFAVIGAPLNAMQTKDIWAPVLSTFPGGKYWSVVTFLTFICGYTLVQEARRRLPKPVPAPEAAAPEAAVPQSPAPETRTVGFLERVTPPLLALYALNLATNAFVYWLVDPETEGFRTILLWSSFSLYLGLFIGLIAQGQKIDEDDDTA